MRAYSTDLKERLVRAVANGQPMREAARRFRRGRDDREARRGAPARDRLARAQADSGPPARDRPRAGADAARPAGAAPDATIEEHCAWWAEHKGQQLSEVTMWRALHRLGWTHAQKKSLAASERDEVAAGGLAGSGCAP